MICVALEALNVCSDTDRYDLDELSLGVFKRIVYSQPYSFSITAASASNARTSIPRHSSSTPTSACVYNPLAEDDQFDREYVVHGDGGYADDTVHVNTCESHASLARRWLSPHRGVSKDRLTPYFRAFQLRREVFRKPGKEALKTILETAL